MVMKMENDTDFGQITSTLGGRLGWDVFMLQRWYFWSQWSSFLLIVLVLLCYTKQQRTFAHTYPCHPRSGLDRTVGQGGR
jgi:hypothetical protein